MHSLLLLINWKRVHIWAMTNIPCIKRNTTFNLENPSKPKTEIIESKTQAARKKIVWDGKNEYCPLFWQGPAPWLEEDGGPSHPRPPSHRHPHPPPHPRLGHFQDRWSLFDNLGLRHVFWHTKLDICTAYYAGLLGMKEDQPVNGGHRAILQRFNIAIAR